MTPELKKMALATKINPVRIKSSSCSDSNNGKINKRPKNPDDSVNNESMLISMNCVFSLMGVHLVNQENNLIFLDFSYFAHMQRMKI